MALVLGDIHGRTEKAKRFLKFMPKTKHIFVGDYCDSFSLPDKDIYDTLKVVIESNAILLLGNHDLHYLKDAPFHCTGYRKSCSRVLSDIFEEFIARFLPSALADGFVITHAGISNGLGEEFGSHDPEIVHNIITEEWKAYLRNRTSTLKSKIFNIGYSRGGHHKFPGIFWADYRDDKWFQIPQVFGHSKTKEHAVIEVFPKNWAVGCDNDRNICFNTKTCKVEEF